MVGQITGGSNSKGLIMESTQAYSRNLHRPTQAYTGLHRPTQAYTGLYRPTHGIYTGLYRPTHGIYTGLLTESTQAYTGLHRPTHGIYNTSFLTLNERSKKRGSVLAGYDPATLR